MVRLRPNGARKNTQAQKNREAPECHALPHLGRSQDPPANASHPHWQNVCSDVFRMGTSRFFSCPCSDLLSAQRGAVPSRLRRRERAGFTFSPVFLGHHHDIRRAPPIDADPGNSMAGRGRTMPVQHSPRPVSTTVGMPWQGTTKCTTVSLTQAPGRLCDPRWRGC
jgi:hypothetical protein